MSGLTQLVNWTSITTTVGMKRLDQGNNLAVNEKNGTVTNSSDTDPSFVRPFSFSDLKASGLVVTGDNMHYTRELRFFVEWESDAPIRHFEAMLEVWSDGIMHCYRPNGIYLAFWMNPLQSITFHRFGVFDTATWDTLLAAYQAGALQRPWFNHALMPLPR